MGKPTGFIEWQRLLPRSRPVEERVRDYREIPLAASPEQARRQAGRCMDCGVPFCMQGCPLGNPIPDFNDLVYRDRFREAYALLSSTNDFPELTGRLCPAPCEAACTLSVNTDSEAVTIEATEKLIVERAFAEGWVEARPPAWRSGKEAGVIGSGPAGLAAAAALNRAGHRVTVYERADRVGGLCRYGIPDFKLDKAVLDRRLAVLEAQGVRFETGIDVGGSVRFDELRRRHDAIVLCIGARRPRDLDVPGRDLDGVTFAMDYLEGQNRVVAGLCAAPPINARGKRVVILGGGDTGSDCLGTAHRQGAASVTQIELLPAPPAERGACNPWPQWPLVMRTSSSQAEGGEREYGWLTTRLIGDGKLEELEMSPVALRGGRLEPTGEPRRIGVDLLLLAMGFVGPDSAAPCEQLGVELDARGNIATGRDYQSSAPGVFAAGDARRGQSLIVWAIAEGREAARHADAYLTGGSSALPSRGADHPFGGR